MGSFRTVGSFAVLSKGGSSIFRPCVSQQKDEGTEKQRQGINFWAKIYSLPLLFLRISAPPAASAVRGFGCGFVALHFKVCF